MRLNYGVRLTALFLALFFMFMLAAGCGAKKATDPTEAGSAVYRGGKFMGENAALSYMPEDGSRYSRIELNNYKLTVCGEDGQTIFESNESRVTSMTRQYLIQELDNALVIFVDGDAEDVVPEYDDMNDLAIYSYYTEGDQGSQIQYSVYFFNGEATWFAEGRNLRIYALDVIE